MLSWTRGLFILGLAGCGPNSEDSVPPGPPSAIHDGMGWRTIATLPEPPDPAGGHFQNSILPLGSNWLGVVDGRLHVSIDVQAIGVDAPAIDPGWLSFDAAGDPKASFLGSAFFGIDGPRFALDRQDALYQWSSMGAFVRVSRPDPDLAPQVDVIFDPTGVNQPPGGYPVFASTRSIDRNLDIAVGWLEQITGWPILMVKPHDAPGMNYALGTRETVLSRAFGARYFVEDPYDVHVPSTQVFTPVDGTPYLFQVGGHYVEGMSYQRVLHVFAPSADPLMEPMRSDPRYKVLRPLQTVRLDPDAHSHLLATPTQAWVLVDSATSPWRVYRFDRATQQLMLESSFPGPLDASTIVSWAATDDGTLYLSAKGPRVLRIADGVAVDLWDSSIAKTGTAELGTLYSTGARVYLAVFDHYPITYTAGGRQTFDYYRFSYITPDVPAVPMPAPTTISPVPLPASCNAVTNASCASGQACDVGYSANGFTCAPAGSAALCGACNPDVGPYCAAGYVCVPQSADHANGKCMRTCCDSSDCGGGPASCLGQTNGSGVGVCYTGAGALLTAACSGIPAVPPSGGACGNVP